MQDETNIKMPAEFSLDAWEFELPEKFVAKYPLRDKGAARLMILPLDAKAPPQSVFFREIETFLPPGALLVLNNTRVLPARLIGRRKTGGKIEYLQLTPLPLLEMQANGDGGACVCEALLRPTSRLNCGEKLDFGPLEAEVLAKGEFGRCQIRLRWQGDLEAIFNKIGQLPLPPYLGRKAEASDGEDYQTVFATKPGAVAAPTAGLHFGREHLRRLREKGHEICELTLHVGYGTFTPVRCSDIRAHHMHREFVEISPECAEALRSAKASGRPVIAVGTTSMRALEGMACARGGIQPFSGWTDIFIYPGRKIQIADGLITNFHLPRSTLLMLVAAMTGRERLLAAYELAKKLDYRFFSYGDAMLIC